VTDEVMQEASKLLSEEEVDDEGGGGEQPPVGYQLVLFFSWVLFSLSRVIVRGGGR
jgi:hypothetical protein